MAITPELLARKGDEFSNQCAVFCQAAIDAHNHPELYGDLRWLHCIRNHGTDDIVKGSMANAEGRKAGVSDMSLPVKRGRYSGLYMELKVGENKLSEKQMEFIEFVKAQGFAAYEVRGWQQAVDCYRWYLNLK